MTADTAVSDSGDATTTALLGGVLGTVKSKWDASKGSEVLASVTSSIPQGTKDYLNAASSRFLNPAFIRSPKVFFGIGEERPFFVERQATLLLSRMQHNFRYFYLNYAIVTAVLFCLTLIVSPGAVIGVGLLGLGWAAVIKATSSGSMTVRGKFALRYNFVENFSLL